MEKKVFCLIGKRCKSIKYVQRRGTSDVEQIRRALNEAVKNDIVLQVTLRNKSIVLQRPDPDRDNKLCDIEENDEVANKSEISVLLVENQAVFPNHLASGECVSVDLGVLYTEPGGSTMVSQSTSAVTTKDTLDVELENITKDDEDHIIQVDEADASGKKNLPSTNLKKLPSNTNGPGSIPYPAPLPELTFDLNEKLEKTSILEMQKDLIYFWGTHLWQVTHGQPSKRDYHNLAMSIVATYPTLGGGSNGCGIGQTQLSVWIRNHRANYQKKLAKRDYCGKVKPPVQCVLLGAPEISALTESDIKNAQKELEKKLKEPNAPHVKRLLEITLTPRRAFIEKEAASISEVLTKYPQLREYEMMVFELLTLKKITMEALFDNINHMIKKLSKFFSVAGSTEESKALVLTNLYDELAKNKAKSNIPALFAVKEMMASTENLITAKDDSPRIVLYIAEEGVAAAYLVADQDVRIKVTEPTVEKSIACLMASYYAWHTNYPKAYSNVLEYIDNEVFATVIKLKPAVLKFIRARDNVLTKEQS